MNLAAASCHLLNRPPLNRPPHVDIRKKSYPSNPRLRGNVTYHICISFWGPKLELGRLATTTARHAVAAPSVTSSEATTATGSVRTAGTGPPLRTFKLRAAGDDGLGGYR